MVTSDVDTLAFEWGRGQGVEPGTATRPQRIWLVGPMGAGKSTTGAALAAALGWRYLDNDSSWRGSTAEARASSRPSAALRCTPPSIAVAESFFAERPPLVAALAASVVDVPVTVEHLRASGRAVYLQVPAASRTSASGGPTGRGSGRTPGALGALLAPRETAFAACADATLDGTAATSALVAEIETLARSWWPAGSVAEVGAARV